VAPGADGGPFATFLLDEQRLPPVRTAVQEIHVGHCPHIWEDPELPPFQDFDRRSIYHPWKRRSSPLFSAKNYCLACAACDEMVFFQPSHRSPCVRLSF
jgi:hypothetical protein